MTWEVGTALPGDLEVWGSAVEGGGSRKREDSEPRAGWAASCNVKSTGGRDSGYARGPAVLWGYGGVRSPN